MRVQDSLCPCWINHFIPYWKDVKWENLCAISKSTWGQRQVFIDYAGFKVSGCGETSAFRLEHQLCPERLTQHQRNMFSPSGWQQVPHDWFALASAASPLPSPRAIWHLFITSQGRQNEQLTLGGVRNCCTAYTSILWRKVNSRFQQ